MPFYDPDVVAEAKKLDLLTYLQNYEPQELVHVSGNVYCTKTHDSLRISNGKWCWFSQGIGGKSALDYLIKVNGYSFLEAMERIVGQAAAKPPVVVSSEVKEKPKTLLLPEKYRYAEYAASYLEKRGISPELISFCISTGRMYESNPYHNVVFVGFDKQGKARFACQRGIYDTRFHGDVNGSDKHYSFALPVNPQNSTVHLFESAIDLLSYTKDLSELTTNMMADCSSMESLLSSTIPPLIANGITVTLTCILLAFFDWRLALCVFCTVPIAFLIIWLSRKHQQKLFEKQVDAKLEASDQVQEYLEGMKIIKSCGLSGAHFKTLNKALLAMKKIAVKVEMAVGVFMSSASMILQAGIGITIFVGALLLTNGQIELLPLLMFLLMVTRIYGPILAILANLSSLLNLNVVTNRMRTLLTTPTMAGEGKTVPNCDIELSHVSFAYNKDEVIKDVSCKIPQGSVTALVGPSGSGKSTISKLIARFWDVQKGEIKVGGKDVKTMEPECLMSYMSFVFQDVTLFNDTVMNNIRLGNPNATDEQVIAAAKAAYCDEFVREMPDAYQTILGENGSTLSGGERQRISIARALLKNAPIILLDEATASLDPENL